MEERMKYAVGFLVVFVLVLLMVYVFSKQEGYTGLYGPSFKLFTSGADQRHATEFSSTNQGYPGNIARTASLNDLRELESSIKYKDEGLVGTRSAPDFWEPNKMVSQYEKLALNEESLYRKLREGDTNIPLETVTDYEGAMLRKHFF